MNLGFTFKDIHSSTFGLVGSPRIPLLPERRPSTVEIPGRDGTFDFNQDSYAPRIVAVDCLVKAASREELTASLEGAAHWLSGSGYLIFGRTPARRWKAKVYMGIDPVRVPVAAQFTIAFECQPYAEDVDEITGTIGTTQDYGSPEVFYPVITVTKTGTTASSLQVALASTGEVVMIKDSLPSGTVIVFDMAAGKVTKNGVPCMDKVDINSRFFGIPSGEQTVSVTTASTYTACMTYRRRFLYA